MLLEDKILYEIKKENFNRIKQEYFLKTVGQCARLETRLLNEGYDRDYINASCIELIEQKDLDFKQHLINENIFSSVLGFLAPGLGDYFKKLFIQYIFKQLGINPDSPLAGFFVNVLRNIKYQELFNYMKSGRCPYIVESLTKAVMDQFLDYVKGQLFAGAVKGGLRADKYGTLDASGNVVRPTFAPSRPTAGSPATSTQTYAGLDVESGFLQSAGEKMVSKALPKEMLQFFQSAGAKGLVGGGIEEILRNNIKQYLMPPLIRSLQKVICEGLDFNQLNKATKSLTTQDKEKSKKAKAVSDKKTTQKQTDSESEKESTEKTKQKRYYK